MFLASISSIDNQVFAVMRFSNFFDTKMSGKKRKYYKDYLK